MLSLVYFSAKKRRKKQLHLPKLDDTGKEDEIFIERGPEIEATMQAKSENSNILEKDARFIRIYLTETWTSITSIAVPHYSFTTVTSTTNAGSVTFLTTVFNTIPSQQGTPLPAGVRECK